MRAHKETLCPFCPFLCSTDKTDKNLYIVILRVRAKDRKKAVTTRYRRYGFFVFMEVKLPGFCYPSVWGAPPDIRIASPAFEPVSGACVVRKDSSGAAASVRDVLVKFFYAKQYARIHGAPLVIRPDSSKRKTQHDSDSPHWNFPISFET